MRVGHGRFPVSFLVTTALRTSVSQSLWHSARARGVVLIGRGSRVRVHRSARLSVPRGAMLMVGLAHDTPSGAALRLRPRSLLTVGGGRVQVMRGCNVTLGWDARLSIGAGTFVNDGAHIVCHGDVRIGRDCAISWGVRILDTDVHQLVRGGQDVEMQRPVLIGNHCWIGAGATVLKGTTLGDGCVVAANSVVNGVHVDRQLLVGAPARAADKDVDWRH